MKLSIRLPGKGKIAALLLAVLFLVALGSLLSMMSPAEIVRQLGVSNTYLLTFLVSLFGGFSAFGSVSFISLLTVLAVGGAHPLLLGLVAGSSLAIGDMVMFYAGSRGRELVRGKWRQRIDRWTNGFRQRPWLQRLVPLGAYLYIGFIPLPNDLLLLSLAAIRYPRRKMAAIIVCGDLTFALAVVLLAQKGLVS